MHHIIIKKENIVNNILDINKIDYKDEYNHLARSLRIKIGEKIKVDMIDTDISYIGEICDINEDIISIKKINDIKIIDKYVSINLYQGMPKSDKLEFIIEKSVELGVDNIYPINMMNSIKKLDRDDNKKIERYNKISKEASIQCMRHDIVEVHNPMDFNDMIDKIKNERYNFIFYENEKNFDKLKEDINNIKNEKENHKNININIIIGPEGGFNDKELDNIKKIGLNTYSLGDNILRTETASIAALCIFKYLL